MKVDLWKLRKLAKRAATGIRSRRKQLGQGKHVRTVSRALSHYCTQTTLHGLRYVVDPNLQASERFLWLVVFATSTIVASNVIYTLALRFQAAPTSINIESMHYKISSLPFPSVTLCPNDRVDWNRALEFERRIFPNDTDGTSLKTYRRILGRLSMMSFGDFDELEFLRDESRSIDVLSDINITHVLREVMPRCEELLSSCWWRNTYRNCCEIFEVQRTEYGFCYSFNSEVAELSREAPRRGHHGESRPRRASGYGEWSGVKVTIHLGNITRPPDSVEIGGVVVIINEPHVWPNSGRINPLGSLVSMSVDCVSGYATQRVLELDEDRTPCKYDKTGVYNQETCLSLCKRTHVIKYCGCNPSFLFPSNSQRDCNIEDFLCLLDYNDLFNDYVVYSEEELLHRSVRDNPVMICDCPPECDYYVYNSQTSSVPLRNMNDIMLDVHYIGQTGFRYKTDIVITRLDLLVSFGGIIGLFLGGSLLSAIELVYYLMVAVFASLRPRHGADDGGSGARPNAPIVRLRTTVLPILDYGPLKPPAKRIPIFANYGLAKSNFDRY